MKKLLSTFIIGCIGLISFCSAGFYTFTGTINGTDNTWNNFSGVVNSCNVHMGCFFNNTTNEYVNLNISYQGTDGFSSSTSVSSYQIKQQTRAIGYDFNVINYCSYIKTLGLSLYSADIVDYTCYLIGDGVIVGDSSSCEECEECQECPIIDSQYCTDNNLCPSGEGDGNWSALYINDIQHQSASVIDITIPDEYDWDYTGDEEQFNLNVIGYNVDTDYIEGIITNQTTKPNQTDLNNIITGVIPLFIPGLVIILFIYFVFKFLKKIF